MLSVEVLKPSMELFAYVQITPSPLGWRSDLGYTCFVTSARKDILYSLSIKWSQFNSIQRRILILKVSHNLWPISFKPQSQYGWQLMAFALRPFYKSSLITLRLKDRLVANWSPTGHKHCNLLVIILVTRVLVQHLRPSCDQSGRP